MKKVLAISIVLLMLCLPCMACATNASLVLDDAGVFTDEQYQDLETQAEKITAQYGIAVYIITVANFKQYTTSSSIWDFAVQVYDDMQLGAATDNNAIVFVISMRDRDYAVDTVGQRAQYAFTEVGMDRLEDRVLSDFRRDDFYEGFRTYLNTCAEFLQKAQDGSPYGAGGYTEVYEEDSIPEYFALIPGVIAGILTGVLMSMKMKSSGLQHDADAYTVAGSMQVHRRSDMFLNRTVHRVPRQTQSSGGGGHGTHHSSGMHSGRSGKF